MNKGKEMNQKKGEYRIDELFSEIFESETMNINDGAELLQDELTKEEKDRILQMAIEKIGGDRTVIRTRGKKRRILTVVLIAVFAFATTAFAAELFQWDTRISNYLGIGEQNSAELSGGGMNVGVSAENSGVTIEAVQTIGDATNMYSLLDVTAPEGEILDVNSSFDMIYLRVDGVTSMGYSCEMIPDGNENDNKATFLFSMDANTKINNKMINIQFIDLRHYVADSGEMLIDYKGEWELEWKLDYEDISTKYSIGKDLEVNGKTVDVESISISPIALNVQISGSYIREYDSAPPEQGFGELIQITAVTLKDGTVLTQDDAASWGSSLNDSEYMINMKMKKLIETDQVKSITLNDTEFVLTAN
ncbi:MAG: hypothetical protein AAGU75_06365 [Bacillota bacterium]